MIDRRGLAFLHTGLLVAFSSASLKAMDGLGRGGDVASKSSLEGLDSTNSGLDGLKLAASKQRLEYGAIKTKPKTKAKEEEPKIKEEKKEEVIEDAQQEPDLEAKTERDYSMNDDSMEGLWFDNLMDLVTRFDMREEYPNNAWLNALGNLHFSTSGTAQLYGFNAGYDYFIKKINTALGGYIGYGYGIFKGGDNGFISNNSHNIFTGLYTRSFIGNHEIDATLNGSIGLVKESLQSLVPNMELLKLFEQRYGYNLVTIDMSLNYGYAFHLAKGYIIKPFVGINGYYLSSTTLNHQKPQGVTFLLNTHNNARSALGLIAGLEGRKYWQNRSYVFLLGQFKQDVLVLQSDLSKSGHATTTAGVTQGSAPGAQGISFQYTKPALYSLLFIAGGGEYAFHRIFINGSVSFQNAVFEKNFGLGLNLGTRFIF